MKFRLMVGKIKKFWREVRIIIAASILATLVTVLLVVAIERIVLAVKLIPVMPLAVMLIIIIGWAIYVVAAYDDKQSWN